MGLLVGDVFRNAARAVPTRVAAAMDEVTLTFDALDRRSNQVRRALAARGVGLGDRVVLWSATSLDSVPVFAALAKAGGIFAPANPALSVDEGAEMIGSAAPSLLVVDGARWEKASEIGERLGVGVVCLDGIVSGAQSPFATEVAELADTDLGDPGLQESDPHVLFFTSGSTGRSKGVVLSHRVNILRSHPGAQLEVRGAMVCPYPLFHMGAWTIAMQQWQARDRVVFLPSATAAGICEAIERHRASRLNCIPGVWRRVLEHLATPEGESLDLSSLRLIDTGTSATPLDLLEAMASRFPAATVRVFYGSTEAGSVSMLEHADFRRKPGSCGVPAPFAETRIAEDGELWVRGPLLFDGYYQTPQATAEALVDGWFRTGDLAEVDPDGFLTIVGRARDVIRTGGETVAPSEVEAALAGDPAVAELVVIGIPDPQWGEVVCVVVVPLPGHVAPDLASLRARCVGRLAPYKHPRRVEVVAAIPRTASTDQVQRRLLVEQLT